MPSKRPRFKSKLLPRVKAATTSAAAQPAPFDQGFWMPAEWEHHHATWLGWPHEKTDWPGKFPAIPWAYAEIVRHLARVERVYLLVQDRAEQTQVRSILKSSGVNLDAVDFLIVPTDRGWMRDSGPICVKNSAHEVAYTHWQFNGWAKYSNHKKDAVAVSRANKKLGHKVWQPTHKSRRVTLEGGSIDVNGRGTLLTTEECLLSTTQERNPTFTRQDYEEIFRSYLGATQIVWLRNGIAGDDTHGHVDDLARFVNPTTIVIASEENPTDANCNSLRENLAILKSAKDPTGKPFRIETLPMPAPIYFDNQRLPASYANFYIANKLVIVPTFNDVKDRAALNKLQELFPEREVVGIACRDLALGLGTLHCLTQQQPSNR